MRHTEEMALWPEVELGEMDPLAAAEAGGATERSALEPPEGAQPCWHLDRWLLASER